MYVFYDASGHIVSACQASSSGVNPPKNDGTPLYLDDVTHADVWNNPGEYTIQNSVPVSTPTPDATKLSNAQQAKVNELKNSFAQSLLNGFTSTADGTNRTYAIDPNAMSKWTGALAVFNSGKGPSNITVKDFNGSQITLTSAQFQQMAADGFTFFNNQQQHLWSKETDTNNAATVDAVDAIIW